MSDTPRTDAISSPETDNRLYLSRMIDHARTLERELAEAQYRINEIAGERDRLTRLLDQAHIDADRAMRATNLPEFRAAIGAQQQEIKPIPCPYCVCNEQPTEDEFASDVCSACGKQLGYR